MQPTADRSGESRSECIITALVFIVAAAYLCLFRRYTTMEPDEGILLQGAQRILRGEVLYRDFFSFLTPGSFYLHAFLFRIFGSSFFVPRTALAFMGGGFAAIGYVLSRRVCARSSALLAVALLTMTTLPYRFLTLHNWDSTLLALLALYCAVRITESSNPTWAFALGSLCTITSLFEQSKGVALLVGLLLGFGALRISRQLAVNLRQVLWFVAGLLWPMLITIGYFTREHAASAMLADWFWPLQHYSAANRVRYGYASWSEESRLAVLTSDSWLMRIVLVFAVSPVFLVPALPIVSIPIFGYWTYRSASGNVTSNKARYYCLASGVLSGLLIAIVSVRADIIHFMYLQPLYGLLLAWILDGRDIPGRLFKTLHPLVYGVLAAAFLMFAVPLFFRAETASYEMQTRRGPITTPSIDTVIPYTQNHIEPGGTLLVYPYLPLYNYFTESFSPVPYDYFQPGMNTGEQSQVIMKELMTGNVPAVLFEPQFPMKIPPSWPGTPMASIAQDPVADYIAKQYRVCKVLESPERWRFLYMVRGDLNCP